METCLHYNWGPRAYAPGELLEIQSIGVEVKMNKGKHEHEQGLVNVKVSMG